MLGDNYDITLEISVTCSHGFSGTRELITQRYHMDKGGHLPIVECDTPVAPTEED